MAEFSVRQHGPRTPNSPSKKFVVKKIAHNHAQVVSEDNTLLLTDVRIDTSGRVQATGYNVIDGVNNGGSNQQSQTAMNVQALLPQDEVAGSPASKKTTRTGAIPKKNWRIEDGVFYIRPLPTSPDDTEIGIGIVSGHATTPVIAHEIVGQDLMLFSIAAGIFHNLGSLLQGPTGVGKTSAYRWLAKTLGFAYYVMPISASTEAAHLVGEYLPMEAEDASKVPFGWTYGIVGEAVGVSATHPTILVFEEINRIGRIAELARLYSLFDDSKVLEIKERRNKEGTAEVLTPGELFIGATMNPVDDENADYLGVQELDPALASRFPFQPTIKYPKVELEVAALVARVRDAGVDIEIDTAVELVNSANRIRGSKDVRFPISFRELYAWAIMLPYMSAREAAEITVIPKCPSVYRPDVRNLLKLEGR